METIKNEAKGNVMNFNSNFNYPKTYFNFNSEVNKVLEKNIEYTVSKAQSTVINEFLKKENLSLLQKRGQIIEVELFENWKYLIKNYSLKFIDKSPIFGLINNIRVKLIANIQGFIDIQKITEYETTVHRINLFKLNRDYLNDIVKYCERELEFIQVVTSNKDKSLFNERYKVLGNMLASHENNVQMIGETFARSKDLKKVGNHANKQVKTAEFKSENYSFEVFMQRQKSNLNITDTLINHNTILG